MSQKKTGKTIIIYGTSGCYHSRYGDEPLDYRNPGRTRDESLALFFRAHAHEYGIKIVDEKDKLPPGKAVHTPSSIE